MLWMKKQQNVKEKEFIIMRWNLLFLVFDFIIIPLPLWIDIFCPIFAAIYGLFVGWLGAFLLTVCAFAFFAGQLSDEEGWWMRLGRTRSPETRKRRGVLADKPANTW